MYLIVAAQNGEIGTSSGQGMGSLVRQLWRYFRVRKKFWLLPILIISMVVGAFVVATQGSAVAPFLYAIF